MKLQFPYFSLIYHIFHCFFFFFFTEEDFTAEEFPEEFMPPPMRDDFVIRDEVPQNNLIPDKGICTFVYSIPCLHANLNFINKLEFRIICIKSSVNTAK